MTRLLRASSFCRPLHTPAVEITLVVDRRSKLDDSFTVYGSPELLITLSVQTGDVVWILFHRDLRIPAVIRPCRDMAGSAMILRIPPTMDYLGPSLSSRCKVQACHREISTASEVTVRPVGRTVVTNRLLRQKEDKNLYPCPEIGSQRRLLASHCLIPLLKEADVFVYEVVRLSPGEEPCWTSSETEFKLEAYPQNTSVPRLQPLDELKFFLQAASFQPVPHPSVGQMIGALQHASDANSPPFVKIIHTIGSIPEHHVDICIQTSSHAVGRRYLKVHGLAAFAHATGSTITTGSTMDKLTGCQAALDAAYVSAPCVLHLVDLDKEFPHQDEPLRHMLEQRIWTLLTTRLKPPAESGDKPASNHVAPVIIVLSTRKPLQAGPLLQRLVFPPIAIDEPDQGYAQYLWGDDASFSSAQSYLIGRSAQEICQWRRLWINRQFENDEDGITLVDFLKEQVASTSLAHNKTMQIPDVHWEDIGGLSHVRAEIMDAIELPLQHPELFAGVTRRTGVLLYGPPGTGKTLVAKAVATECGLPFFSVKGPELLGSYVGESEANVRQIFRNAREAAKKAGSAILFFDELDSLAPRRGGVGDGGGVMERVVATLLTELDRERTVFLIGATNRPDLLDPSMLRPGRLDRRVYLGLPTEKKDRAQVLAALIRKFRLELPNPIEISLQVVEKFPRGLSGADFSAIANGALMLSLKRLCDVAESHVTPDQPLDVILDKWDDLTPLVTARDLIEAAAEVVPSVTEDELRRYQHLQEEFSSKLSVPATPIRVTAVGSCVSEITPPPQIRHLSAVTSPAMRHLSILGLSSAKNVQDRTNNKV